jgi:hypothetical protein
LLISEGHTHANIYPLSKLWLEVELARERINSKIATEASLIHTAIVAVLSLDGKGVKNFNDQMRKLTDG